MDAQRECRSCGVTDLEGLVDAVGEPMVWQDDDLCSVCHDAEHEAQLRDAARYRFLRARQTTTAALDAGIVVAGRPSQGLVLAGEDLDRAIDKEMTGEATVGQTLERRLALCLADIVDKPILSGRDEVGAHTSPLDIRLGFFHPDLANRAAELLEEAGL